MSRTQGQFIEAQVRRQVQGLISKVLDKKKVAKKPEDIAEGLSLTRDLAIDSLDILQLSATVEKKYGIKIPEEELRRMDDLGGILTVIQERWPGPARASG